MSEYSWGGEREPDFQIFGDWRDLRGAIERAAPEWKGADEETRKMLWDFAQAVIAEYAPFKFQCLHCKDVALSYKAYPNRMGGARC